MPKRKRPDKRQRAVIKYQRKVGAVSADVTEKEMGLSNCHPEVLTAWKPGTSPWGLIGQNGQRLKQKAGALNPGIRYEGVKGHGDDIVGRKKRNKELSIKWEKAYSKGWKHL